MPWKKILKWVGITLAKAIAAKVGEKLEQPAGSPSVTPVVNTHPRTDENEEGTS